MKKEQPSYYAILTADVRYSKELSFFEKVLYADITALTNKNGYCTASNGYFAELFDKAKETISRSISKMEKLGFLRVVILRDQNSNQIIDRKLYLLTNISIPVDENVNRGIDKNINRGIDKNINRGIDENIKENSTSNNNTSINIKNKQKDEVLPDILNLEAFNSWCEYKGPRYSKQGRSLAINKLIKYPTEVQQQMVDNSIMNDYKGLFEIKPQEQKMPQIQIATIDAFEIYTNYRNRGMSREVAETRAITETSMKYPATDRFLKATEDAEFEIIAHKIEQKRRA